MSRKDDKEKRTWRDERELRTRATPTQMWQAWAEPRIIAQWFADEAAGSPSPGEHLVHRFPRLGFEHRYEVLEADPPHRLRLRAEMAGREFIQEVLIRQEGGETVLRLVHSGFGDDEGWDDEYEGIDSGWKIALAILRHYLEHHFGRPKTSYFVLHPTTFDYDQLPRFFRSADGLSRWLTTAGSVGAPGERYSLCLRDAGAASGLVLAWTGREAALTWEEISGTLELKAFGGGDQRFLALRASSWSDDPPGTQELEGWMGESLERLASVLVE